MVFTSCKNKESEYHTLYEKIEGESKKYEGETSTKPYLEGLKTIEITEDGHTFLIPERKGEITSYSCLECHSKPLHEMQSDTLVKKAHWNIKMNHADDNTMNCVTCHNGNNMNTLKGITGKEIDFNLSYKLCGQCHTNQFKDWAGGAHGKRIGGWAPPRASMTCVNCHNPHDPHFETRLPVQYNTRKEEEIYRTRKRQL